MAKNPVLSDKELEAFKAQLQEKFPSWEVSSYRKDEYQIECPGEGGVTVCFFNRDVLMGFGMVRTRGSYRGPKWKQALWDRAVSKLAEHVTFWEDVRAGRKKLGTQDVDKRKE